MLRVFGNKPKKTSMEKLTKLLDNSLSNMWKEFLLGYIENNFDETPSVFCSISWKNPQSFQKILNNLYFK